MKMRWVFPLLLSLVLVSPSQGADSVTCYLFSARGCVNCVREERFLAALQRRLPGFEVRSFEVQSDRANARLLVKVAAAFGVQARGVPLTFIGSSPPIEGYQSDETTGRLIEERVRGCLTRGCEDVVGPLVLDALPEPTPAGAATPGAAAPGKASRAGGSPGTVLTLPLLGTRDLTTMPLLALTVILGALDSFNPCAFFVLFTLLGILVHARSRRRMLLIGGSSCSSRGSSTSPS